MLNEYTATITTDTGGAATVYLGSRVRGQIVCIKYAPGTLATGAGLTITADSALTPIMTKTSAGTSNLWFYPVAACWTANAASTASESPIYLYNDRAKVVVASGGNTLTGTITMWVEEEV